jgi:hypothetical protein
MVGYIEAGRRAARYHDASLGRRHFVAKTQNVASAAADNADGMDEGMMIRVETYGSTERTLPYRVFGSVLVRRHSSYRAK